jgi:hypothetical protein
VAFWLLRVSSHVQFEDCPLPLLSMFCHCHVRFRVGVDLRNIGLFFPAKMEWQLLSVKHSKSHLQLRRQFAYSILIHFPH